MYGGIPRNDWQRPRECLGMFEDIPRDIWRHPLEYDIPRVPRIPFPVPVFLVLYLDKIYTKWI